MFLRVVQGRDVTSLVNVLENGPWTWNVFAASSDAVYKRWMKNTDFENPLNWNVQPPRAPCGNDRVIIPEDSPVVYFQMNTTLRELVSKVFSSSSSSSSAATLLSSPS